MHIGNLSLILVAILVARLGRLQPCGAAEAERSPRQDVRW
jgi:hypothetical protein